MFRQFISGCLKTNAASVGNGLVSTLRPEMLNPQLRVLFCSVIVCLPSVFSVRFDASNCCYLYFALVLF
ncbi:Uncharacterized protein TCM_034629 [Theobroma cacao]|uniref:Uncharacterized protein n=1 Tax=Theobroma cacao TaxID=3641 RepID=A0A061FF04_THECC|nr:Uncharacterized protein TCM_034629 [Theobroma cacao]